MKIAQTVFFGFVLGVAGVACFSYLGIVVTGGRLDWQSAMIVLTLLSATQWISFFSFRHNVTLQILFGLALFCAIAVWLFYSRFSFFWEIQYPDGSSPITWRSGVVISLLLAASEYIAFLVLRWGRLSRH